MNANNKIRFTLRGDADQVAEKIREREIRINAPDMGMTAAMAHANWMADQYRQQKYDEIEDGLDD